MDGEDRDGDRTAGWLAVVVQRNRKEVGVRQRIAAARWRWCRNDGGVACGGLRCRNGGAKRQEGSRAVQRDRKVKISNDDLGKEEWRSLREGSYRR